MHHCRGVGVKCDLNRDRNSGVLTDVYYLAFSTTLDKRRQEQSQVSPQSILDRVSKKQKKLLRALPCWPSAHHKLFLLCDAHLPSHSALDPVYLWTEISPTPLAFSVGNFVNKKSNQNACLWIFLALRMPHFKLASHLALLHGSCLHGSLLTPWTSL